MAQRRGVVDHHDDVARGHRREVRGAQQTPAPARSGPAARPAPRRARRGATSAGGGAMRSRVRQPRAQLARPALHAAELRPTAARPSIAAVGHGARGAHPPLRIRFHCSRHETPRPPPPPGRCSSAPPTSSRRPAPGRPRQPARAHPRGPRRSSWRLARESHRLHRPWTYPPERADQFDELYSRSRREDFLCLLALPHRHRRDHRRVHDLPDRPRRLPVRLPRLLRPRAPRRPGPDARGARADPRPLLRPARPAPGRGQHPARQRSRRSRWPAAPGSASRASPRATC